MVVLLLWSGSASAADQQKPQVSGGIPGILKYVQQYQQETVPEEKGKDAGRKGKAVIRSVPHPGQNLYGSTGNTELRRRLTLREQELRLLKKENRTLRDRLHAKVAVTEVSAEKDREVAELKVALTENRKQLSDLMHRARQAQEGLNAQVLELKQQQARAGTEKAELQASLTALKAELAGMPVVTPEMLKPEAMQHVYATGVMMGRDILTLQAAQQQLGLKTDNRILVAGIRDALNRKVLLNEQALGTALQQADMVIQKARLAVIQAQKKAGEVYLAAFRKRKGVKQAESGFWYRVGHTGDGKLIKGDNTRVDVVVTEKLTDGTVVEDMDLRGQVISQLLGDYPPVFRAALMLMKNHGTMDLVVPSDLAYGNEGYPPKVPPGATVHYVLRVENVTFGVEEKTAGER
ncbi:FKBP-type peptidyl-prolyl cis-trans isomerase N-terminal domain-containing protein [Escherichia coli]|uniref:FKBP-type peptidyl-prolyl cis-trans isomerase N-terminal domain-containing protein n=1 Tax=Escherichia coli TaxID=562 RepID=UPI00202BB92D|nr:FKBP-type peptidyl-prolyl cis-trans isomerase N-terminal domain-containing protein [Escherichia coli]